MIRRMVDFAVALAVLPALVPLFAVVCLAIIIESPGSPLYGGWRVGNGGKPFRIWKFRTMVMHADKLGTSITTRRDPRVTRVGWFLRKTKVDELPQFFNLLLGDLTLIGPRPESPSLAQRYTPEQKQLFTVKPGITGPVQLRYTEVEAEAIPDGQEAEKFYIECVLDQKVRMDIEYLKTRTFLSDCRVVLQTILLMARAAAVALGNKSSESRKHYPANSPPRRGVPAAVAALSCDVPGVMDERRRP
jgi:lipopolysaccharide/colanic/teichoic acid biosynthesis glycosyltransferase